MRFFPHEQELSEIGFRFNADRTQAFWTCDDSVVLLDASMYYEAVRGRGVIDKTVSEIRALGFRPAPR